MQKEIPVYFKYQKKLNHRTRLQNIFPIWNKSATHVFAYSTDRMAQNLKLKWQYCFDEGIFGK